MTGKPLAAQPELFYRAIHYLFITKHPGTTFFQIVLNFFPE